ncbi:MAG: hypothetical protein WA191_06760 [Telluria sp.]
MAIWLLLFAVAVHGSAQAQEKPFRIPTDAKAVYTVLERGGSGNIRTIVTKRDGSSGTSYSQRQYDCDKSTWKYIGTGDTIEQMKASKPDAKMGPIVNESIASYVGGAACDGYYRKLKQKM